MRHPEEMSLVLPLKPDHRTLTDATADALRNAIQQGSYARGSKLPPELELIELLGVSRATLREALRTLEEQGFIVRKRGLGTYVCEQSIVKDLSLNFGISEMITQAGLKPGSKDVMIRRAKATAAIASALQLENGTATIQVERIRTSNDRPVVWSIDILSEHLLAGQPITTTQLEKQSLYSYLEETRQIRVMRGIAQLYPTLASSDMARKLSVKQGTALMQLTQTDYDENDTPILYSIEYHLPDVFVFRVNRKGPHW
jgi:GntR family transcriptional regulator